MLVRPDSVSAYNLLDTITPDPAMGGSVRDVLVDTKHHRLFTAETNTNRVLVYNLTDTNKLPDKTPDNVIGQRDFSTGAAHLSRNGINCGYSCGLEYDSDRDLLFVSDGSNCRVLIFDLSVGVTNGMDASYVIGQPNFTTSTRSNSMSGLSSLKGRVAYDGVNKRLFVPDVLNERVLVYDLIDLKSYPTASNVLTLPVYDSYPPPEAFLTVAHDYLYSGSSYSNVGTTVLDAAGQRLFVSDRGNNYIVVYDVAPGLLKNTSTPINNIGNCNSYTWWARYHVLHWLIDLNPASTAKNNTLNVTGLGYDKDRRMLYVQRDSGVGIFDVAEISNGEDAIGHHGGTGVESVGMGFDPINRWLYVPFNDGSIYIYEYMHVTTPSLPSASINQPYSQKISVAGGQGNVDIVGIVFGVLPPGLKIDSEGDISGTPTQLGSYSFDYKVTDDNGDNGVFTDTKSFTINVVEPQAQGSVLGDAASAGGAAVLAPDEQPTGAQSQIGQSEPGRVVSNADSLVLSNMPSQMQIAATIGIAAAILATTMLIVHRMRARAKG